MDGLIRLFTSKDVDDVFKFYDSFGDSDGLISWLKGYPYAPVKFYETDDESDNVVVITLPDHNSVNARMCRKMFKGTKIVFAESSGPYFDFSRSANEGLRRALSSKPKWVALLNDDIAKKDEPSVLNEGLDAIDHRKFDVAFRNDYSTKNGAVVEKRHTRIIAKANMFMKLAGVLAKGHAKKYVSLMDRFDVDLMVYSTEAGMWQRLYTAALSSHKRVKVNSFQHAHIFSSDFIRKRKGIVFDEVYRNGMDDIDLDLYLHRTKARCAFVNFNIEPKNRNAGGTMGAGPCRVFRNIANQAYFAQKVREKRWL